MDLIARWFAVRRVSLKITRARSTKTGDFRPPRNGNLPVITVNGSLNRYAFLITLVHEIAHYHRFETCESQITLFRKRREPPHGSKWKEEFRCQLAPFLTPSVFPEELLEVMKKHMKNPRASTYSDPLLARVLMRFDPVKQTVSVEEIPEGAGFVTPRGLHFRKEGKLRKRYRCICVTNRKTYLFSPLAQVIPSAP